MERRKFIRNSLITGTLVTGMTPASGAELKGDRKEKGFIKEASVRTPIKGEYDVIVCGGGPAGVAAAIASACSGARTMVIEQHGCLGGIWTSGMVQGLIHNVPSCDELIQELVNDCKTVIRERMTALLD